MATSPKPSAATTSTSEPFHLLVLVDRSIDVTALVTSIGARGYDVRTTTVENPHDLKTGMVTSGKWELVLTPVAWAPEVLKLLRQCTGLPPRVIVFGPTEDVTAIEFLEQGAVDVVRTQPPARLHLVVARELAFVAERRARVHAEQARAGGTQARGGDAVQKPTSGQDTGAQENRDILTGLYTRNFFIGELDKALADTSAAPTASALVHVVVDNYQFIRDKIGVAAADLALSDIAGILSNILGTDGLACRFGSRSDDNVFLLWLRQGIGDLASIGERIRTAIEQHESEVAGNTVKLTCSIGICPFGDAGANSQKLIYWAALSAQIAQKKGGNRIHIYDMKTDARALEQKGKEQESRVAEALQKDRFKLVFQPIVNLCASPAERYEVLLRMLDDGGKEIMPAQFMPSAEKGGLMPAIDRWVIGTAIRTAGERMRNGRNTNLFVKLSGAALLDAELLPWIATILKSERVTGDAITFELTEASVTEHLDEARRFFKAVRELHCRTAIERAGMNPGVLEAFDDLPLHFLKFDRSLTHDFPHAPSRQDRVKKLVRAAHELKRETIAEFVQDARTLRLLWQCGVDYIQGYYLQQPDANLGYEFSAGAEM